jgi:hypothetical protein
MLALRDLQAAFAAHLGGADRPDLIGAVTSDAIPAAARLDVYRHHVLESLSAALAATFPTVQALVGPDFFRKLARDFVRQCLPTQPVMAEYGAEFPAFLVACMPLHDLPYLADVARLDWALNVAFQAPADQRLTAADLSGVPPERLPSMFVAMPHGTALITSPYPLDLIWQASQPDAVQDTVDLNSGGSHLLVLRRIADAVFISLSAGEAAFLASLGGRRTLEQAAAAACQTDPAFDLSNCFPRLLALGAFAALQ